MSKRICFWGDSIMWGAFDPELGGWVGRLRNYFEEKSSEIQIYNLGVSGDTSADLVKRFETEARARRPWGIVFAIGINDSQYENDEVMVKTKPDDFKKNLESLLNQAALFTDKIVFIGLTPVDEKKTMPVEWNNSHYYSNKKVSEYDNIIKNFCLEKAISLLPLMELLETGDLEDGLHPNSSGHKKIMQAVKSFLNKEGWLG